MSQWNDRLLVAQDRLRDARRAHPILGRADSTPRLVADRARLRAEDFSTSWSYCPNAALRGVATLVSAGATKFSIGIDISTSRSYCPNAVYAGGHSR